MFSSKIKITGNFYKNGFFLVNRVACRDSVSPKTAQPNASLLESTDYCSCGSVRLMYNSDASRHPSETKVHGSFRC